MVIKLKTYAPYTAHMSSENAHKLIRIYMGGLILGVDALYMLSCLLKQFALVGKAKYYYHKSCKFGDILHVCNYALLVNSCGHIMSIYFCIKSSLCNQINFHGMWEFTVGVHFYSWQVNDAHSSKHAVWQNILGI